MTYSNRKPVRVCRDIQKSLSIIKFNRVLKARYSSEGFSKVIFLKKNMKIEGTKNFKVD